ncbi:mRNA stability protein [Caenorhabditis elegans]|uniref:mRNA stability protein n=1 Tax=Caenorhabditis elegans TaxID=6239 RepID=Q9XU56_CAEEL|nr:mRNA stability protein [Caenorhabditis elegans]CAB05775.1 mRNA stability protein [Caenorhabditis elegans]|eukprot:NP_492609.1 ENdoSulfine Alpha [Caenorhabditis elegans]
MRGEAGELAVSSGEIATGALSPEKQQEQELMGKLAATGKLPARPASSFLQKKLQQRKFFDSGDYAMDKSKAGTGLGSKPHPLAGGPPPAAPPVVAQRSPAPAATTPSPSASPISQQTNRPSSDRNSDDDNLQIPRPDTVPQRKASIINPSVHCKLSPAPHVQHHDAASPNATSE